MRIAQGLYEDGAITYMRTDGVQMDGSAISAARKAIANRYDGELRARQAAPVHRPRPRTRRKRMRRSARPISRKDQRRVRATMRGSTI